MSLMVIHVKFPAGKYGGRHGYRHIQPAPELQSRQVVEMMYGLYIPTDFDPVKGGKLPGLLLEDGTCLRLMWLRDDSRKKGMVGMRWYIKSATEQFPEFRDAPGFKQASGKTSSDSLFPYHQHLVKGQWNTIVWRLDYTNERLEVRVNGTTAGVRYRFGSPVYAYHQHFFYGGSNASWAPPTDQTMLYTGPLDFL